MIERLCFLKGYQSISLKQIHKRVVLKLNKFRDEAYLSNYFFHLLSHRNGPSQRKFSHVLNHHSNATIKLSSNKITQ